MVSMLNASQEGNTSISLLQYGNGSYSLINQEEKRGGKNE